MAGTGLVVAEGDFLVASLVDPAVSFAGTARWHAAFGEPVEAFDGPR